MSGTNDEYRTGSADSENSSDSFVQVNKEDAAQSEQLMDNDQPPPPSTSEQEPTESGIPAIDDGVDIYGAEEDTSAEPADKEVKVNEICSNLKSCI